MAFLRRRDWRRLPERSGCPPSSRSYLPDFVALAAVWLDYEFAQAIGHSIPLGLVVGAAAGAAWARAMDGSFATAGRMAALAAGVIVLHDVLDLFQDHERMPFWPLSSREIGVNWLMMPNRLAGELLIFGLPFAVFGRGGSSNAAGVRRTCRLCDERKVWSGSAAAWWCWSWWRVWACCIYAKNDDAKWRRRGSWSGRAKRRRRWRQSSWPNAGPRLPAPAISIAVKRTTDSATGDALKRRFSAPSSATTTTSGHSWSWPCITRLANRSASAEPVTVTSDTSREGTEPKAE
jgi:hypothetical protein